MSDTTPAVALGAARPFGSRVITAYLYFWLSVKTFGSTSDSLLEDELRRSASLHANLYFGIQRLRGGVTRDLCRRAMRYMEADRASLAAYVAERIEAMHGVPAAESLSWLATQPLVDRSVLTSELTRHPPDLHRHRFERRKTSGSTGTPFSFFKDTEMTAWMDAVMWAAYRWHGIEPGLPHVRFWGMPIARRARLRKQLSDSVMHRVRVDAFSLSSKQVMRYYRQLRRMRPRYAYGYPTLMRQFVEQCVRLGLSGRELGVRVAVVTGELISPGTRETIGEFFDCRVVNEYGCTEAGVLGFECEMGGMHATPIAAYPEIVTPAGSLTDPGQPGEVVVTDLYGQVMPLTRYRLHDRASWLAESCPCGRHLPLLRIDSGRVDSFIQTPHRGPVYDAILAYTVPPGVQRFRAYQTATDQLVVDIVPGSGFGDATTAECKKRWEAALGPGMHVSTRIVSDLPYEVSGKLKYFVPLEPEPATAGLVPPVS